MVSDINVSGKLILIFVLTMINAFFAASEMAMVSVDRIKLTEKADDGNKKAKMLIHILKEPSRFLSTIQVGITFAGFFSSASAAVSISTLLGNKLEGFGLPFARDIAFIGITLILSYIMLVFGELVPKRIAIRYAEKFAMFAVRPINFISKLMKPFVSFLSISTNTVLGLLGISKEGVEAKITLEEISSMVEVGHEQGFINPAEREMIKSVISFDDKLAEEVMTARTEVFMIDVNDKLDDYIDELLNLRYSRIPVYEDYLDNIIGVLYIKDFLFEAYKKGFNNVEIRDIIRPAYFVPERKNINDLFMELKNTSRHFAILVDEYGGFSGIVTMEDLIEEIMGDIDDEYDKDDPEIRKIGKATFLVRGSTSVKTLNNSIGTELAEDSEEYDTLGGFLIYKLGYIPVEGQEVEIEEGSFTYTIEEIQEQRIISVRVESKNILEKGSEE